MRSKVIETEKEVEALKTNIPCTFPSSHLRKNNQAFSEDKNKGEGAWYIGLALSFWGLRNQVMGSDTSCSAPRAGRKVSQPGDKTVARVRPTY